MAPEGQWYKSLAEASVALGVLEGAPRACLEKPHRPIGKAPNGGQGLSLGGHPGGDRSRLGHGKVNTLVVARKTYPGYCGHRQIQG